MKQKIFFLIFLSFLFFAKISFAARTVPTGTPLQPVPQNTGPSYSQSVNSDQSIYSQNQKLDQQQISPSAPSPVPGANAVTPNPTSVPAANSVVFSTEPIWLYWILLIVGSLGLVGALAWLYWRFR